MTSCLGYCTNVTNKEFPGLRSSPILVVTLKLSFSVCFKSCSLISETEMGFTLSTRNAEELGYCLCIWIKSASLRRRSAVYNKRCKRSHKAKGSMQSVNTITSYWQAVTEAQKWAVTNKFTSGWHVTARQGSELATGWRGVVHWHKKIWILWLKVVIPKPATYRESWIMMTLDTSHSQTYKKICEQQKCSRFPCYCFALDTLHSDRGRREQYFKNEILL